MQTHVTSATYYVRHLCKRMIVGRPFGPAIAAKRPPPSLPFPFHAFLRSDLCDGIMTARERRASKRAVRILFLHTYYGTYIHT